MRKKKKDNKKFLNGLMAVFVAFLMIGSIAGYMWSGGDDDLKYNGYKFKVVGNYISLEVDGQDYYFYYHPTDLLSLNVSEDAKNILANAQMVYVTFDPEAENIEYLEAARFDLAQEFSKTGRVMVNGQVKENDLYSYPIITCENSTESVPVIYLRNGEDTTIYYEDGCVMADASFEQAFFALKDEIMYIVLGVL